MSKQTESKVVWKNLLCGGLAGAAEATIMYPTEFVKTQLQLDAKAAKAGGELRFKGIFDCARQTIAQKGVVGLYSGLSTLVVGSIPKAGIRFASFNFFKSYLADGKGKLSPSNSMFCGLLAGISEAVFAVTPMETVKTKLIHDQNSKNPQYRGLIHGVTTMVKQEGLGAIYKGVVPTMAKQGGNQACRFTVFEQSKTLLQSFSKEPLGPTASLVCGSFAGFVSVYVTMPFDVVKTQMQGLEAKQYKNSFDCLSKVVQNEGVTALWKGTVPRLSRVMCSSAIIFACYEQLIAVILTAFPDP